MVHTEVKYRTPAKVDITMPGTKWSTIGNFTWLETKAQAVTLIWLLHKQVSNLLVSTSYSLPITCWSYLKYYILWCLLIHTEQKGVASG